MAVLVILYFCFGKCMFRVAYVLEKCPFLLSIKKKRKGVFFFFLFRSKCSWYSLGMTRMRDARVCRDIPFSLGQLLCRPDWGAANFCLTWRFDGFDEALNFWHSSRKFDFWAVFDLYRDAPPPCYAQPHTHIFCCFFYHENEHCRTLRFRSDVALAAWTGCQSFRTSRYLYSKDKSNFRKFKR